MSLATNSSDVIIVDSTPPSLFNLTATSPLFQNRDEGGFPHFAVIYIDQAGNIRYETSTSISRNRDRILSPEVTTRFLQAVSALEDNSDKIQCAQATPFHGLLSRGTSAQPNQTYNLQPTELSEAQAHIARQMGPAPHGLPVQWPEELVHQSVRTSVSSQDEVTPQIAETVLNSKNVMISLGNASVLRRYYEKVFENLQQTNCRILAKVYVRLVEPRKQVKFPYNGRKNLAGITHQCSPDETKPPWWPLEVRHREPDHLYKAERIELLVHILCELRASHGVTARRLRAADEIIRRQICPTDRINLLDELYYVREKEEKLLDDVNARVSISRDNVPNDLELTIFQNSTCARRSPRSQKSEEQRIPQDPFLLSGPIREVTHTVPLDSGTPDSETTRSPHQMSFASPRSVPTSTSVFLSDFEYGNEAHTSYLSTPGSVCMEHYFLSGLDYQSYLTDPSQEILAHRLEHPSTKARRLIETNKVSVNIDGFNQALKGCAWH